MERSEMKYAESATLFDIRCDRIWFRKFRLAAQREILRECDASIVTYVSKQKNPFGGGEQGFEQSAIELTLSGGWLEAGAIADIMMNFRPDGYEISPSRDELVMHIWWKPRLGVEEREPMNAPESTAVDAIVVRLGEIDSLATIVREFGSSKSVWIAGNGPWLVSSEPLSEEHVKVLLPS